MPDETLRELAAAHPELLTVECEACGGTRGRGYMCPPCHGTGRRLKTPEEMAAAWCEANSEPAYRWHLEMARRVTDRPGDIPLTAAQLLVALEPTRA